jgi:hypothetical protein
MPERLRWPMHHHRPFVDVVASLSRCHHALTRICESVQKVFNVNDLHPISFCQTQSDVDATQLVPVHTLRRYVRTHSNDVRSEQRSSIRTARRDDGWVLCFARKR